AEPAVHPDPPAVELDELPAQRETEPCPFRLLLGGPDLAELLEHRRLIFGRDADPRVGDRHLDGSVAQHSSDCDPSALGRELDRIRQQVQLDLPDLSLATPTPP